MEREIIKTEDGSTSIKVVDMNETYHSTHGAIQEAYHVFIKNGLNLFKDREIKILEIGFGTGLNTYITYFEAENLGLKVVYETVEYYPLSWEQAKEMNYVEELKKEGWGVFEKIHTCPWEEYCQIGENFVLKKRKHKFEEVDDNAVFDLIYFDAFGAQVQPELWGKDIFEKMYKSLKKDGYLVTYSSKGSARRAMQEVGFVVERLEGPIGKREMLRAKK